ncbi:hypothetical protein PPROV_000185000 [Pycnococcus provasolii]|uniref:Histone RNA hairpin-binding protein RNA-binding domain-containing protein n=1 Tax=Pycnococcus provasolii TaxID=41880 RepID=A0A830H7X7_9CHLO|nr:hypothetical protein PPROV_000185000 [Pycnococcus provasolii]
MSYEGSALDNGARARARVRSGSLPGRERSRSPDARGEAVRSSMGSAQEQHGKQQQYKLQQKTWAADPRNTRVRLGAVPPWAAEHRAMRDALGDAVPVAPAPARRDARDADGTVDHTAEFELDDTPANVPTALAAQRDAREEDARRLAQRQKQIDFGKNTRGYERYSALVPREKRKFDNPWTPDKTAPCSKRAFDGRIRKWRRELHKYDEEANADDGDELAPVDNVASAMGVPPTAPRPTSRPPASALDLLSPTTGLPQDPFSNAAAAAAVDLFGGDDDIL